jgi:hypothetical protein
VLGVASLESKLKNRVIDHLQSLGDNITRSSQFSEFEEYVLSELVKKSLKEWPHGS